MTTANDDSAAREQRFQDALAVCEVVAVARKVSDARVQVGMVADGAGRPTYKSMLTQIGEKQPR